MRAHILVGRRLGGRGDWRANHENIERKQDHCGGRIVFESHAASFGVTEYMAGHGLSDYSVNPNEREVLGERVMRGGDVPEKIDIVSVFSTGRDVRRWWRAPVRIGAKVVWMQSGIENEEAAEKARAAGLVVI